MKTLDKTKEAYEEILNTIEKHRDLVKVNTSEIRELSKKHLYALTLEEVHGFNIDKNSIDAFGYLRVQEHCSIATYSKDTGRKISWEDDGKIPDNELLLRIYFPTGAYIFGEDYPESFFKEFWLELKSYKPAYVDTRNSSLYYSMDNASKVYNDLPHILAKYRKSNKEDKLKRDILKKQKELDLLIEQDNLQKNKGK